MAANTQSNLGFDMSGPTAGKSNGAPVGFIYYDTTLNRAEVRTPTGWLPLAPLSLPTSDPAVSGQLWNHNGTVTISGG